MGYQYSLRIAISPDFLPEEKILKVLDFCEKAKVDDIQFFVNMEELNDGHQTLEDAQQWLDMIASFLPMLHQRGIRASLNPWSTILHTDRGRTLKKGQNFETMTDHKGLKAQAVACPLDPEFREYISQMYRTYAKLGFDVIWVEDDFRLHNHAPLSWGGCFCPTHMNQFEQRLGKQESREEFARNMTMAGAPTPERIAWLDTMRETMNGFAKLLGDAVHQTAPETRVGLMSSAPQNHAIEGRQWDKVLEGLSGETRPLNRLHMAPYSELSGREYCLKFQRFSRLTAALLPENVEKWPELESYPYSSFAKSDAFTKLQIETSLSVCAGGISMNIFDLMGNGVAVCEHNQALLSELKPYLEGVTALKAETRNEAGICVLVSPDAVYHTHCPGGEGPGALWPWQTFWAEYLSAFGISNHMAVKPKKGEIVALGGQILRGMTPKEIYDLASQHCLLLDGESVEIMVEKGCGDLIQAAHMRWHMLNGGDHSYEQVCGEELIRGFPAARMGAQALSETVESGDYLEIEYTQDVHAYTCLRNWAGKRVGAGLVQLPNAIIFPYGHFRDSYEVFLNPVRRSLLSRAIGNTVARVHDCQFVTINQFPVEQGQMILLTNFSTDSFAEPELTLPFKWDNCYQVDRISGEIVPAPVARIHQGGKLLCTLRSYETMCLLFM